MIWVVLLLFFLFSFDKLVSFGDFCGVGSRVFLVIVVVLVVFGDDWDFSDFGCLGDLSVLLIW